MREAICKLVPQPVRTLSYELIGVPRPEPLSRSDGATVEPLERRRKLMTDAALESVAQEYHATIQMLASDHDIRLRRNESFLRANASLVALLALVAVGAGSTVHVLTQEEFAGVGFVVSVFGITMGRYWARQHERAAAFVRFHAWQLRQLEALLGWTTFRRSHQVLDQPDDAPRASEDPATATPATRAPEDGDLWLAGADGDYFHLSGDARESSTAAEQRFVTAVRAIWVVVALGFVALFVLYLTNTQV
jgi:hypothetical protein